MDMLVTHSLPEMVPQFIETPSFQILKGAETGTNGLSVVLGVPVPTESHLRSLTKHILARSFTYNLSKIILGVIQIGGHLYITTLIY
jgi:hypothetical protein